MGELAGAGTQIERGLTRTEPRALGCSVTPGAVAVSTEEPVASVVAGGHLVEHLSDPFRWRLLPHAHDYGRLRPYPDCDRCCGGVR